MRRESPLRVARFCVRKRVDPKDVGDAGWGPGSGRADEMEAWPAMLAGRGSARTHLQRLEGTGGDAISVPSSPMFLAENGGQSPAPPPSLSAQLPSPPLVGSAAVSPFLAGPTCDARFLV